MKTSSRFLQLAFSLLMLSQAFISFSQDQSRQLPYTIQLQSGSVQPVPNTVHWLDSLSSSHFQGTVQVMLQFYNIPDESTVLQLKNAGVSLADYIPNYTYISFLSFPLQQALPVSRIRSITPVRAAWKMSDQVKGLNQAIDKRVSLLVSLHKELSNTEVLSLLNNLQATITDTKWAATTRVYEVSIAQNSIQQLASNAFIKYIGLAPSVVPLNDDSRAATGAAYLQSPVTSGGYGLDGTGITVGVGDNTSAIIHVDARDRVINFNTEGPQMHGIHTTLTTAGNGTMDPKTIGMMPSARIIAHLYDLVWGETPSLYPGYNMTLTNNSYASVVNDCSYAGTYDQSSQVLDDYAREFPYVQNVFAGGNDGLNTCGSYPSGYTTVNGGYQPSKNILVVGGIMKNNALWPKSSRGPVKDGRLKPEVVAFAYGVYSGNVFDMYGLSNGTSMASPIVTGCLGLLTQRYKQLHGNANPPANLLKTLAMNGATDLGNPGPDFTYGFGSLNVYRSLQMLNNNSYLTDSVANGANNTHTVSVASGAAQLKIMLYWNDVSATPLAATALVNNLDLDVKEPGGATHLPLILNPTAAAVTNNAAEGVDNLNNAEQIVINNPSAGNYTVTVKGSIIPAGKQPYVVAYDIVPTGVYLKFPTAGIPLAGNDSVRIYWDASDNVNTFTLEFSDNNGGSWTVISNTIPSDQRHFFWLVPNVSTSTARMRITRNNTGQQSTSGTFVVAAQPVVQLNSVQCPGYIGINWNAITGVSGYEVLQKIGDRLQPIDTITTNNYIISGLSPDTTYYVAVRPMVNGLSGYRSKAITRKPNDGNCSGGISDGDLRAEAIINPASGRKLTSTALNNNETLNVRVRNLDDVPATNFKVSYRLNTGAWISQVVTTPIAAGASAIVSFMGLDLSAAGIYTVSAAVENLQFTDPVKKNDTIFRIVKQLNNDPVDLDASYTDGFETSDALTVYRDSMGVLPGEHWDYHHSTDTGRLRTFVSDSILISGDRSVSLDLFYAQPDNQNHLTGTFNLAAYSIATTETRLEFDYKIHGRPKYEDGNDVYIRGNDAQPWVKLYGIDTTVTEGQVIHTGSLPVSNVLTAAGQNFSSSFQVRIGQRDTSVIAANYYGNGMTIDNFKLYSVKNDVQLLSILSPRKIECGLSANTPLTVRIYNSDNLSQSNIQLYYRLDNGPLINETLPLISAKDTIDYTFTQTLNLQAIGYHNLDVWLVATGDTYLPNDSLLNYRLRNQPVIATYPYLENFETADGNWFTEGQNSSWEYGVPAGTAINRAASGSKIWTTGLSTNYNNNEQSYLYSPCFDISSLTRPMLSFSLATDIENCGGNICDAAYAEYSEDGINWTRLGTSGAGTNWYGSNDVWNEVENTRWRVASIPLPNVPSIKIRFVFHADAGAQRDGIGVDDIHIFDLDHKIYEGVSATIGNQLQSNGWVNVLSGDRLLAQFNTHSQDLGNTSVTVYPHTNAYNPLSRQYYLPRNYVVHPAQQPSAAVDVRFFITDEEVMNMLNDQSCDTCRKAPDAYRLGITKYNDDLMYENGSWLDNRNGHYTFIPYTSIQWVPYDNGYYAATSLTSFSEIWFNTGIPGRMNDVVVYPNPVTNSQTLHIIWTAVPGDEMHWAMYDVAGRKVYNATVTATDYDNTTNINLPALEAGMYLLRYQSGKENRDVKIIVR